MIAREFSAGLPAWFSGDGPDADVVISTRVRLARSFSGRRFPHLASLFERKLAFEDVAAAFQQSPHLANFECVNCASLSRVERQFLVEQRLISPELMELEGDRGVAVDAGRKLSVMINEEDHLRLQCLDGGCRPSELLTELDAVDDAMSSLLDFAFDQRRGFLTCRPANSGTGMRVSFLVHLPGLILTKNIDQVLLAASQMGLGTRGFFGEHAGVAGALFQLSNTVAVGVSESELIENARGVVERTVECERAARQRIVAEARPELLDKINRAFGILTHATMLEVDEFLNLSSAIRMGIDCNLFNPTTIANLNRLTLLIMPGHLQTMRKQTMTDDELKTARALAVKEFFANR